MNLTESPNGRDRANNAQCRTMNSPDDREPRTGRSGGGAQNCFVCGYPIGDRCFFRIYRKEAEPIMLCCPDCTIQYLHAARPPADDFEKELRAYDNSIQMFIGEDNQWS